MAAFNETFHGRKLLITQRGPHRFLFEDLDFNDIIEVPMTSTATGREFDVASLACLPECDLFVNGASWMSKSVEELKRRLRPARSVGFFPQYDVPVGEEAGRNWVPRLFALARACGATGSPQDYRRTPRFSPQTSVRIETFLSLLPKEAKIVVLHFDTLPEKMWPMENWLIVLSQFLSRRRDCIALIIGLVEPPQINDHADRVISLVKLPLEDSMYLVSRADAFLGVDSCMLHVADHCMIPSVGIFVSTDPAEFGPYFCNSLIFLDNMQPVDDIARIATEFLATI